MKKIGWWLLPTFFLFVLGCGGGGQTTSGTTPGGGVEPALPAGYGVIKLNIQQGNSAAPVEGSPAALAPVQAGGGSLPIADSVRIAARLVQTITVPILDDNDLPTGETVTVTTEVFRKIVDAALPTSSVSIAVPAADGYTVEVLSTKSGTVGTDNVLFMLKYGKTTGVNVTAGDNTAASITAKPITAGLTINLPDNVIAGSKYTVPAALDNIPLRGIYNIQQFVDNVNNGLPGDFFVNTSSPSNLNTFTAQSLTTHPTNPYWDLYFQMLFFIDPSWQNDAEKSNLNWYKKFVFYYPNRNAGWLDPYLKTKLYPLGTVNITVTLSPER